MVETTKRSQASLPAEVSLADQISELAFFFWNTVFQDDGHTDSVVCLILYVSLASTAGNCFRNKWLSRWPNLWVSCSVVRAVAVWSDHQQFFSVYLRWVIWVTSLALHEMHVLSEIAPSKIASCIQDFIFYLNYWRVGFCVCVWGLVYKG